MGAAKPNGGGSVSTVKHVVHEDGSHSIGCVIDGYHVPFATLDPARIGQLVQNAADTAGDTQTDEPTGDPS